MPQAAADKTNEHSYCKRILITSLDATSRAFLNVCSLLSARQVTVTVLATTDMHGNILPYDYLTGKPATRGLAKIATLIQR